MSPLPAAEASGDYLSGRSMVLRLTRTWTIECPPAKFRAANLLPKLGVEKVRMVPTAKNALTLGGRLTVKGRKNRRLTIEIHGPEKQRKDSNPSSSDRRGSGLRGHLIREEQTVQEAIQLSKELLDDDRIVVRICKPRKSWGLSRDSDDSSDSDSEQDDDDFIIDGYVEYRKYGIDEIVDEELTGRHKNIVEATMGLGNNQERRELKFDTAQQGMSSADLCLTAIEHCQPRGLTRSI